ncbi:MAG: macro domain-containing protein [Bacteroidales bacterium]|nr:macro domain-containing protein [Bacteroidales bacterium]MDT8430998.1 macro domain-containing protein [Bacteroidales bacterium]
MNTGNVQLEAVKGDITDQPDITAIVNAANAHLRTGGGVAGAIHRAAGPGLAEEARQFAPIQPGEAVITGAHQLPNRFVIHCLGPVYGVDKPEAKLLADCYRNAIRIAEENRVDSIAFPAISTGAFGFPIDEATDIVAEVMEEVCAQTKYLEKVRFVLFSDKDLEIYREKLNL